METKSELALSTHVIFIREHQVFGIVIYAQKFGFSKNHGSPVLCEWKARPSVSP